MRGKYTSILVIAAVLLALTASVNAYREVIDLGALPGYGNSVAYSINDSGQIVGVASESVISENLSYRGHAVLFDITSNGNNIDLGDGGAFSINNNGQIVGIAYLGQACLFDHSGGGDNINLGFGKAFSINDNALIVGQATSHYAAIFNPTGGVNKIIGNSQQSTAFSVNNRGQIVGDDRFAPMPYNHATLFNSTGDGSNIDLGTLGGRFSWAKSINDLEQIVGDAYDTSNILHAVLFDSTGGGDNIDLGTIPTFEHSIAMSINESGQIVGYSFNVVNIFDASHAVLFDPTGQGQNIDLNSLIDPSSKWTLRQAFSINNSGWIVGTGTHNGQQHAFLLIPEPASVLLFALAGLSAALNRKKR